MIEASLTGPSMAMSVFRLTIHNPQSNQETNIRNVVIKWPFIQHQYYSQLHGNKKEQEKENMNDEGKSETPPKVKMNLTAYGD